MILVTGAAGKTGRAIIRVLIAKGQTVRALIRRPEQTAALESLGVPDVVVGDMTQRADLEQAIQGMSAIYHMAPNMHPEEVAIGRTAIRVARDAGCERFVYHSVLHPQTEAMPHHWNKLRVEESLFESGLQYTILQPAAYMQNVLANWDAITRQGVYEVPYSVTARFSMVDLDDVAAAAAIALTEPGHGGAIYELCGPQALSSVAVAEILEQHLERPVRATPLAIDVWKEQARTADMDSYRLQTLAKMFHYYDSFGLWGNSRALEGLLGRPAKNFAEFVTSIV